MKPDKANVLIVDDKPENLFALAQLLKGLDIEVTQALSGPEALALTLDHDFCVALVDVQMPGMDGYELAELLRSSVSTAALPIIFVSAVYSDAYHHRRGYEAGAVDFISKPFVPEILLSKIKIFIELAQQRQTLQCEVERRRQAEENLLELNEELTQANDQLKELDQMKDQFVANVSYALRSPQAVIKLYLSLLEQGKPEKRGEYMQTLHREVDRLELMLEDLLDLSKIDQGQLSLKIAPLDLNELLGQILSDRIIQAEENGLTLRYAPSGAVLLALADPTALRQVVPYLLTNAVTYTPAGGRVIVTTAASRHAGSDWAAFTIKDTGPGISSNDLPHIFERFYRGAEGRKVQPPGAGLGLAIAQEIVERLGGHITVENLPATEGSGTAFTVWLKPGD
jgi:signal transduction histidine kinase